ncbi:hypothetical protein ACFPFP_00035 [Bradyrhizobium sp. GCM10023182]|uniref:Uncharacterized protein n=1 Tax=Bradyrhizobium zhengyangense TaxID=2911009 RepID=A0ABS9LEA5_9BRAD|nr:hypothetical protein [Bradyrhizobium zhengyangense]MCG2665315.1 hypothetical protein [Bradyrhizobium zhengyangense]
MTKIKAEDGIADIETLMAAARQELLKLPAEAAPNNDQVRKALETELAAILAKADEAVHVHLRRLRGVDGHA